MWEANGRRMTVSWWEETQASQRREEKAGRAETSRALCENKIDLIKFLVWFTCVLSLHPLP